jgi:hypothetical protein
MQLEADLSSPPESFAFQGALTKAPFSGRALLASIVLHAVVVAGVVWFSRGEHKPSNPVLFMDLKAASLGTGPAQPRGPAPSSRAPAAPTQAPAPSVTAESLEASAESSQAEKPADPAPTPGAAEAEEARVERTTEAQGGASASAQVPVPPAMSEIESGYRRAVWERVREVALPWSSRSSRWLFEGWISFHMCLDASGRLLHDPVLLEDEEGRKHRDLRAVPAVLKLAPPEQLPQFLDWHFKALVQGIRMALVQAQPYPPAPPGLRVPENMAFPIDLNLYDPPPPEEGPR